MAAWSAEEDAKIAELLKRGNSFGVIAKVLNRTRNSIIGRSHRLGLANFVPEPKLAEIEAKDPGVVEIIVPPPEPICEGVNIIDIRDGQCRFSTGRNSNDELVFCAETVKEGSVYCPEHHGKAFYARAKQ
jgi:hypothetical protein